MPGSDRRVTGSLRQEFYWSNGELKKLEGVQGPVQEWRKQDHQGKQLKSLLQWLSKVKISSFSAKVLHTDFTEKARRTSQKPKIGVCLFLSFSK